MKIKEFAPQAYLSKVLQKTAPQASTGAPMPQNLLPKGPIKSNATVKTTVNKSNQVVNKNLLKVGTKLPMPTAPGKEQDMEIVSVGMNDVKLKSINAKQPGQFTVNKKDLDPVISNLLNRSRSQTK